MKNLGSISNANSVTTKEYVDNRVVANPQSSSTPTELEKLTIGGLIYEPRKVIANPTLAGTEAALSGIQIGDTKYNMGSQSNIARVESGTTATKAYVVGEYVVVGGQLYRVTAAIASGGTFTPGTNVSATSVGNRLQSIESSVRELGIYRFVTTLARTDKQLVFSVPVGSVHLVIADAGTAASYSYLGLVCCYQDDNIYYTVAPTTIYARSGSFISVTGSQNRTQTLTVTFAGASSSVGHSAVFEVITLLGDRMTLIT